MQSTIRFLRGNRSRNRVSSLLTALPLWWVIILASLGAAPKVLAQEYTATMRTVQPADLLAQVAVGQSLKLENVLLDSESTPVTLELERFEVFAPDARIVVHRAGGEASLPPPAAAYFRGRIPGRPDSLAVLSADPSGTMRGIVQEGEKLWVLGGGPEAGGPLTGLTSRELRRSGLSSTVNPFQCGFDKLPQALRVPRLMAQEALTPQSLPAGQFYGVPVAIETDGEFFNLFGNSSAATSYIGNLFAYASTIYQREASAKLIVSHVSLWSGGPNSDPWNHTDIQQGLMNFQNYWNTNRQGIKRATAHFLSARNLGGGIAYLGVLCNGSYGYGYSASISGNFQITNPQPVWDLIVVTHEIGHNFNSPHTHDYEDIGNNSNPVDVCTSGYLPGVNSLTGGTPGAGNGTIMSYCHLLGGWMSNLALKFGLNHPYGIAANRVSSHISSYVAQVAGANPSCISVTNSPYYTLSVTKAGAGTGTVTSSPAGISCGADCSEPYSSTTSVTLTATPATSSVFAGWSGACTGTAPCNLTMAAAKNVTATFNSSTATYSLTVAKAGTGTGTVTSSTEGISCGTDCTQTYTVNTVVTLAATSAAGSVFAGWSGACVGTTTPCKLTMNAVKNVTATFNKPTGSDLIVTAVSGPLIGKAGGTITVSVTVKNQGVATAQNSWVEFLFSKDTTITLSDIGSGWGCYTGVLAAGASISCSGGIGVPANLAPGTYYLGAYADKTSIITESNETNNGRAVANTIFISQ